MATHHLKKLPEPAAPLPLAVGDRVHLYVVGFYGRQGTVAEPREGDRPERVRVLVQGDSLSRTFPIVDVEKVRLSSTTNTSEGGAL